MELYCACHEKCIFADLVETSHACHCFFSTALFWQGAGPAPQNNCAARATSNVHLFGHFNFQKGAGAEVFVASWLWNLMCFAPQPPAHFQHVNFQIFQKWSDNGVLLCGFTTLTWKCLSLHNGARAAAGFHFYLSSPQIARCPPFLRAYFSTLEPQHIEKTQCFATVLQFHALWFSFFWLLLFSDCSHQCRHLSSSVRIVGNLTSELTID